MKTGGAGINGHIQQTTTSWRRCVKFKRRDGVILAVTEWNLALAVNVDADGQQTYQGAPGFFPSQHQQTDDLRPGQAEIEAVLNAAGITEADLQRRLWDGATARYFVVNALAAQPIAETIKLASYKIGRVTRGDFGLTIELLDQVDALATPIVRKIVKKCAVKDLGDAQCGVLLLPPAWQAATIYTVGAIVRPTTYNGRRFICTVAGTSGGAEPAWNTTVDGTTADNTVTWTTKNSFRKQGTVATVTSRTVFTLSGIPGADAPDNFFRFGKLRFTSGANNGVEIDVLGWASGTGQITLFEAAPFDIAAAVTVEADIGCDRNMIPTCRDVFDNVKNNRGFWWVPGRSQASQHV